MDPRFQPGDRVKLVPLIDGFGRQDPRSDEWIGKTGEVTTWFYASFSEVWEKTLKPADTFCYDIRLPGELKCPLGKFERRDK